MDTYALRRALDDVANLSFAAQSVYQKRNGAIRALLACAPETEHAALIAKVKGMTGMEEHEIKHIVNATAARAS
ncbi:hypothetical protein AB0O47_39305 [Streptomyces noursei]|uniref:hypothetical protein n=1 Tax=Streptomyces noursei TaxID=1971 RepID=UPI00344E1E42